MRQINGETNNTMSVDKLQRIMWRLQGKKIVSHVDFERAIMREVGTDPRTIRVNIKSLEKLGWAK